VIAAEASSRFVELSARQQQSILQEAGEIYERAVAIVETDPMEAGDLFVAAAAKYQLLIDAGIRNSNLYINLANACLQSNQLGRAIANYERARQLDPNNRQLAVNLELANSMIARGDKNAPPTDSATVRWWFDRLRSANDIMIKFVGRKSLIGLLAFSSIVFWGILIARTAGFRRIAKRWTIFPLLLLVVTFSSVALTDASTDDFATAIAIQSNVTLRSGDGDPFEEVRAIRNAQGHRFQVLTQRGQWTKVRDEQGQTGWIENNSLEILN